MSCAQSVTLVAAAKAINPATQRLIDEGEMDEDVMMILGTDMWLDEAQNGHEGRSAQGAG
jgi:hypothetical protein